MNLKLPLKVRIIMFWVLALTGPLCAVTVALIGTREPIAWVFYFEAVAIVGYWIYSIVLLRRLRREQRAVESAAQ